MSITAQDIKKTSKRLLTALFIVASISMSTLSATPSSIPPSESLKSNTSVFSSRSSLLPPNTNPPLGQKLMALEKDSDRLAAARKKLKKAMNIGSFLQRLDSLAFMEFPIVMSDTIGGVVTTITFDQLELHPEYAEVEVLLGMKLPQRTVSATLGDPKKDDDGEVIEYVELIFGTPNLKISHNGGIVGEATLGLYSNVPIGTMDPNKFGFILEGWREESNGLSGDQAGTQKTGTFVTIDCDGFVEMGVEAQVIFSRDWIVPVDENGLLYETGQVTGRISLVVQDWNNMLATVDLPDFALKEYPDLAFNLTNAVFDFSDYRNSPTVKFPPGYREAYLPPGNPNLWRGVYIQNLEMMLPLKAGTKNPSSAGYTDYYTVKVEIFGTKYISGAPIDAWRPASKKTFFPDSWSEQKIIAEIAHGFQNKVYQSTNVSNGSKVFLGKMSDNTSITIIVRIDQTISTAYPSI